MVWIMDSTYTCMLVSSFLQITLEETEVEIEHEATPPTNEEATPPNPIEEPPSDSEDVPVPPTATKDTETTESSPGSLNETSQEEPGGEIVEATRDTSSIPLQEQQSKWVKEAPRVAILNSSHSII